jgi:lipoprotein-releasing system permease protein
MAEGVRAPGTSWILPLRIAVRFIRTSAGQSLLIAFGIAVGIAVQIFVGTLITSLQANLLETTIGNASHVTLLNVDDKKPIVLTPALRSTLRSEPLVKLVVPVRSLSAIFSKGSDSAPVAVIGADPADLDAIFKLRTHTVAGAAPSKPDEIMLGRSFTDKYKLKPGDPVLLTLPGGIQHKLRLSGVFDVGAATVNDRTGFTTSEFTRRALGLASNEYTAIQTQLTDPFASGKVIAEWRPLQPFREVQLKDWQDQNRELLTGLQGQASSSYMIQVFVLIAVALGIASTLAISAVQKTRQIGILKAMGLTDRRAGVVFLWEAAILGGTGTALGAALGLALVSAFAATNTLFAIVPRASFIIGSCAVGLTVSLLSAVIPLRRTSRLDPIEVIQGG